MTVFSDNGIGRLMRRGHIACVWLAMSVCWGATDVKAGDRNEIGTVAQTERFAFTGVYRFRLQPAATPAPSARAMAHPLTSVSSPSSSKPSPSPDIELEPLQTAASKERFVSEAEKPAAAPHGLADIDLAAGKSVSSQQHPINAAILDEGVHTDTPPVQLALSKPANSAGAEKEARDLSVTRSVDGRIIDVPPLPELYHRPASQSRIRPYRRTYRSRRGNRTKSQSKSVKTSTESAPAGGVKTNWMSKALSVVN